MTASATRTPPGSPLSDFHAGNADTVDRPPRSLTGPLRLNPATSLSMIYLREFERTHSTMRGKVRIARKAGHMLRMHWAHVRAGAQGADHETED